MKKIVLPIIGIAVIIAAIVGWFMWSSGGANAAPAIDSSKYQVVSLSDGQVYFGKLSRVNDEYLKLSDVYYLQPVAADSSSDTAGTKDVQNTAGTSDKNNFKLVKFTDIIYGPENAMVISKDQIIHYDNLDPNGKVAKGIAQSQ